MECTSVQDPDLPRDFLALAAMSGIAFDFGDTRLHFPHCVLEGDYDESGSVEFTLFSKMAAPVADDGWVALIQAGEWRLRAVESAATGESREEGVLAIEATIVQMRLREDGPDIVVLATLAGEVSLVYDREARQLRLGRGASADRPVRVIHSEGGGGPELGDPVRVVGELRVEEGRTPWDELAVDQG